MRFIFLSPHLDDIALSCGGIVNSLINQHQHVEIWTFFAGIPSTVQLTPFAQSLHQRWNLSMDAPRARREEDIKACSILGSSYKHFDYLDCIYRVDHQNEPLIEKEEDLYQAIPSSQDYLVTEIRNLIFNSVELEDILISPMAIGDHIDHRIILKSMENLGTNKIYYYEDFPYILNNQKNFLNAEQFSPIRYKLSLKNITKWHEAIAAYTSQISTFWKSVEHMKDQINIFLNDGGGSSLWEVKN